MKQTMTIDTKIWKEMLKKLDSLSKDIAVIKAKLLDEEPEPPYGSDEWWEWSIKKGQEDFRHGRYVELKTEKELRQYLDSLK